MIEVEHWVPTKQEAWESQPNVMGVYGICRYCMATAPERCGCEEVDPLADGIWLRLADGELRSWCGCAEPGKDVLACGHCGCGNSDLCWEWIVDGSDQLVVKRRKASCV